MSESLNCSPFSFGGNIIRFGLYGQILGISMGSYIDLYMFCNERDFMLSHSDNDQADFIETSNSTLR